MAETPGGNSNPPDSTDRITLPTSFKRSFDELALDYDDEDAHSRNSSSSSGLNTSLGHNSERTKRARSTSEHEPASSSTAATNSTTQDDDVDMLDGMPRSHVPSPLSPRLTDDLAPALAHISSTSSTLTTAVLPPTSTHEIESSDSGPPEDSFRLSMERYTAFDSNISALRNSVGQGTSGIAAEARPTVDSGVSSTNTANNERPIDVGSPSSRLGPSTVSVGTSHSRPEVTTVSDDSDEERDNHPGRAMQESFLRYPPYPDYLRTPRPPTWTQDRDVPGASGRDEDRERLTSLTDQADLLIDVSRDNGRVEMSAGASAPHTSRLRRTHYLDWNLDPPRSFLDSWASRNASDRSDLENRTSRGPRSLPPPEHRTTASRSRSVDDRPMPPTMYPTPLSDHEDTAFLRDAIATFSDRSTGLAQSSRDTRIDSRTPGYGPRLADIDAEYYRQRASDLERERERILDRYRPRERLERVAAQFEAELARQEEVNRPLSPASFYGLRSAPGVRASDSLSPYSYSWYIPPPPNLYPYSRYSLPYPYYPYAYPPSYYTSYSPNTWGYSTVPPPPPHRPVEVEMIFEPRPSSVSAAASERSAQGAGTSDATDTTRAAPAPDSATEVDHRGSFSPWLGTAPPTPTFSGTSTTPGAPDGLTDSHPTLSDETPSSGTPVSPRSRMAHRPPQWLTSPPNAVDGNSLRGSRALPGLGQRVAPASSPLRHGFTASRETSRHHTAPSNITMASQTTPSVTNTSEVGASAEVDSDVAEILAQMERSEVILQRMANSCQTSTTLRELMQRVVDSHNNLREMLRRPNGGRRQENRAAVTSIAPPATIPVETQAARRDRSGSMEPLASSARATIATGPSTMDVDNVSSGGASISPTGSVDHARVWDYITTSARYALGISPTDTSHSDRNRELSPSGSTNWTDRLAELTSASRARSGDVPAQASARRADNMPVPQQPGNVPASRTAADPVGALAPAAVPLSAAQTLIPPLRVPQSRDIAVSASTNSTSHNVGVDWTTTIGRQDPALTRLDPQNSEGPSLTAPTIQTGQNLVAGTTSLPTAHSHEGASTQDRRLTIESLTCSAGTPWRSRGSGGGAVSSSPTNATHPRPPATSLPLSVADNSPLTATGSANIPSLPPTTGGNDHPTRTDGTRVQGPHSPGVEGLRLRRGRAFTDWDSSSLIDDSLDPLFFPLTPRRRGANRLTSAVRARLAGDTVVPSTDAGLGRSRSSFTATSRDAPSSNSDSSRMNVDRDRELELLFAAGALGSEIEANAARRNARPSADAMAVDSTGQTDTPSGETNATQSSPVQGSNTAFDRASDDISSTLREHGSITLEGMGTRNPTLPPGMARTRSSVSTPAGRSTAINLSVFSDGPFRDSLARTLAFQSRHTPRSAADTPRAPTGQGLNTSETTTSPLQGTHSTDAASRSLTSPHAEPFSRVESSTNPRLPTLGSDDLASSRRRAVYGYQRQLDEYRSGAPPTAASRSDVQNANRARREALERYRDEQSRTHRPPSWAPSMEGQVPWADVAMTPWERHRSRVGVREREDLSGRPVPREYHDWVGAGREGTPRASRRISRDDPAMYDWPGVVDVEAAYESWFSFQSLLGGSRSRGVPDSIVNNLPGSTYGEWAVPGETEERCPICFDDYQANDPVLKLPNCSHWLHKPCLQQWLKNAKTCPVCRSRVENGGAGESSSSAAARAYIGALPTTTPASLRRAPRRRMVPQDLPPLISTDVPYATLRTPTSGPVFLPPGVPPRAASAYLSAATSSRQNQTARRAVTPQRIIATTTGSNAAAAHTSNVNASASPAGANSSNTATSRTDTANNNNSGNSRGGPNTDQGGPRRLSDSRWPGDEFRNPWE